MKKLFLFLIRFYQRRISPALPARCRFLPTCSQYALEAIERFGALRGGYLALRRILRCHPFYRGPMYDPVPGKPSGHGKSTNENARNVGSGRKKKRKASRKYRRKK